MCLQGAVGHAALVEARRDHEEGISPSSSHLLAHLNRISGGWTNRDDSTVHIMKTYTNMLPIIQAINKNELRWFGYVILDRARGHVKRREEDACYVEWQIHQYKEGDGEEDRLKDSCRA